MIVLAIRCILLAIVSRCGAVDPPPTSILSAPIERQLQYSREQGAKSLRLRSEVASRRFEEKKRYTVDLPSALAWSASWLGSKQECLLKRNLRLLSPAWVRKKGAAGEATGCASRGRSGSPRS